MDIYYEFGFIFFAIVSSKMVQIKCITRVSDTASPVSTVSAWTIISSSFPAKSPVLPVQSSKPQHTGTSLAGSTAVRPLNVNASSKDESYTMLPTTLDAHNNYNTNEASLTSTLKLGGNYFSKSAITSTGPMTTLNTFPQSITPFSKLVVDPSTKTSGSLTMHLAIADTRMPKSTMSTSSASIVSQSKDTFTTFTTSDNSTRLIGVTTTGSRKPTITTDGRTLTSASSNKSSSLTSNVTTTTVSIGTWRNETLTSKSSTPVTYITQKSSSITSSIKVYSESLTSPPTGISASQSPTDGISTSAAPQIATTGRQSDTEKSLGYDKEIVIIFGVAVGLGVIVTITYCILKSRRQTKQERYITGGGDIEINTSKF